MAGFFQLVNYKARSYVMVEGKSNASNFFIIRQGKLQTQREAAVIGQEATKVLGPGDFFGVVSAMSNHSRIESVIALTDCSLISVRNDQFGLLIQKNAPVAMKIIRQFSMQLRAFNTTIAQKSAINIATEDPAHLFELGEYWFNQKRYNHAAYAYQKYLVWVPKGKNVSAAKMRLQSMNKPLKPPPIEENSISRSYKTDDMVFCENEPGRELYIIQSGKVKITKMEGGHEVMLAVLSPGEIFGEMALLDNKPRSASAICAEDAVMLAINKANFEGMVKAQPQLATKLITLLSERTWMAYRQLNNLMITDPVGKLYDTLLSLVERNHVRIAPKTHYKFEISPKDLLIMVGFDPKKDERLVMELFKARWLRLEDGIIHCQDLEELEKQVAFYRKKAAMERKREKAGI